MPELPEVETIKRQILPKIKGEIVDRIIINTPKIAQFNRKDIIGEKILDIRRRAKLLIISLTGNNNLVIHLKLTGQILWGKETGDVIFYFESGKKIAYKDLRKFGYIKNVKNIEEHFKNYGPEPLEESFTLKVFKEILIKKSKSRIKPLLMDQSFIAGVGNIYAQEACFYAKIKPDRKVGTLKDSEIKNLYIGLRKILLLAIENKGSSVDDYLDLNGEKGSFVPLLKVYGKKECATCKGKISKIKLGGRGTSFCPNCQE